MYIDLEIVGLDLRITINIGEPMNMFGFLNISWDGVIGDIPRNIVERHQNILNSMFNSWYFIYILWVDYQENVGNIVISCWSCWPQAEIFTYNL